MKFGRRSTPRISVVVPVYEVADYLAECLDSVLAQAPDRDPFELEVVVVDDGSTDGSGAIADGYAERDARVRVVHTANHGLGAARNTGIAVATGDLLAFADSDDVVPPGAYAALLRQQRRVGADLVTGSIAWWRPELPGAGALRQPPWMKRLHATREAVVIEQHAELLGDVFAWNKLFVREFWDAQALRWPEGTRYEDQPTCTRAYLAARRIGVIPDVVYHWRIRSDGTSITQQRGSLEDLRDRWATKRATLGSVTGYGSAPVTKSFVEKVLPGDLHRYFVQIPGCSDEWWELLRTGVLEFFATRSLARSDLPPVHRLTGWLVEQGRRDDATLVMTFVRTLPAGGMVPRVDDDRGRRLDVPGLDVTTVPRPVLAVRENER